MKTKFNKLEEIDKSNNPFKVPEDYFTQFNEDIMKQLPEKQIFARQPIRLWDRVKPWVYLAAMFIGMHFTINILLKKSDDLANEPQTIISEQFSINTPNYENYWSTVQMSEIGRASCRERV